MSTIKIKKDVSSNEWLTEDLQDDKNYYSLDVYFGFYHQKLDTIEFNTLKFGCDLYFNDQVIQSKIYPLENVNMFKTQSEYLQIMRVDVQPATTYKIKVWCNNLGIHEETFKTFTTPAIPNYREMFFAAHPGETEYDGI